MWRRLILGEQNNEYALLVRPAGSMKPQTMNRMSSSHSRQTVNDFAKVEQRLSFHRMSRQSHRTKSRPGQAADKLL